MNLQTEISPVDSRIHQQNMSLLASASVYSNIGEWIRGKPDVFGGGDHLAIVSNGEYNTLTQIFWNEVDRQLLVIARGMQENDKVPVLLGSWDSIGYSNVRRYNAYFNGANALVPSLPTNQAAAYDTIRLIGHSYGGAMMHHLAKQIRSLIAPHRKIQVYTYGAPKPNDGSENSGTALIDTRRVCLARDPVPRLPPGPSDMGNVWVLAGVPTARRWAQWRQVDTALQLQADGEMAPAVQGGQPSDPGFIYTLASWLAGVNAFGAADHSLDSYRTAIGAMLPALEATRVPETTPIRGTPVIPTIQQMTVERDMHLAVATATIEADPVGVSNAAFNFVEQTPRTRFRGITVQGKPWVYYGTIPVIPVKSRRTRRALVRRLNRMLVK